MKFGIELESELLKNYEDIRENMNYYHSTRDDSKKYWIETDGSLRASRGGCMVEIITAPFEPHQKEHILDMIENDIYKKTGVFFNDTTGCHIHVSFGNEKINSRFKFELVNLILRRVTKTMRTNLDDADFKQWKSRKYRSYAKRIQQFTTEKYYSARMHDKFNTLELRFFHLYPLQNWSTAKKALLEVLDIIEKTFKDALKTSKYQKMTYSQEIDAPKPEQSFNRDVNIYEYGLTANRTEQLMMQPMERNEHVQY